MPANTPEIDFDQLAEPCGPVRRSSMCASRVGGETPRLALVFERRSPQDTPSY